MGEISDMIINGDIDYITGEYLGPGNGFPRTQEYHNVPTKPNKYGYSRNEWKRMNSESKEVVKLLYEYGFKDINSRQSILDSYFLKSLKWKVIPKNNKKYKLIHERLNEFINFLNSEVND